jgi:hypothetical protein
MSNQQRRDEKASRLEYEAHIKQKTETVKELELNARYNKANFDIMYYSLEAEKIKPEYQDLLKKMKEEQLKAVEEMERIQKEQAENGEAVTGEVPATTAPSIITEN